MKSKILKAHSVFSWLFILTGMTGMGLAYFTRPTFDDYLIFHSLPEVVSLEAYSIDDETGCIIDGIERSKIRPSDRLYVKVDAIFLKDVKERYRTWLRNMTQSRNLYENRDWSGQFEIAAGADYCPYQTLEWWIGHSVGELREGVYRLATEYELEIEGGRVTKDIIRSIPFIIEK